MVNTIDNRRLSFVLFWLSLLFTGLALTQLGLVNNNLSLSTFLPLLVWTLCSGAAIYFLHKRRQPAEPILLPVIYLLSGLGLVLISRLAPAFIIRQLFWLVIATAALLAVALIPKNLSWLPRYKFAWLGGGLLLLATTLVWGINPSGFGPRLWLQLGNIYFQPSEPLKLLLVIFLAGYLADHHQQLVKIKTYIGRVPFPHPSYFGPMFLMWGFSIVLLVWQRDLGAAFLFFGTFLGMLYAATGQARYIWAGSLLLAAAAGLGYYLFDVVQLRFEAFLNPWLDPSGRSFQVVQSLLAFASGGLFGQGLGQGLPTAIPVVHTDFVFAAIGEEYGLWGTLAILACFALLVSRAFQLAVTARSEFDQLLAAGIGIMLGLQTLVIMAGTLKLMPLTGVTLPFVSYGGSSLVTSFIMVGLLLFIAHKQSRESSLEPLVRGPVSIVYDSDSLIICPACSRNPYSFLTRRHLDLARGFLNGFIIVAAGLVLWQVAAAPFLVQREDNPRPIIAEQRIDRGRLLTAAGIPVAETVMNREGLARRLYPYPELSSVTGYYSLRHGLAGTEAIFDPILRGSVDQTVESAWQDELLHRPLSGRDVTLTIDLPAQVAADVALGKQEGAVVVMEIESGAILVMSSHPTYDPNTLDEEWEVLRRDRQAPLLNRATQGLFPVGDLARFIGLIGLYEAGATLPQDPLAAPLADMLAPLSQSGYLATARQLELIRPLPGLPSQPGRLPDFDQQETVRELAVTPLHLVRVLAALELEGRLPDPVLSFLMSGGQKQAIGPDTVRYIYSILPQVDEQIIGLAGQASPEETGQAWLSWFIGLAPAQSSSVENVPEMLPFDPSLAPPAVTPTPYPIREKARYAVVVVVVTDRPDNETAFRIARMALDAILD